MNQETIKQIVETFLQREPQTRNYLEAFVALLRFNEQQSKPLPVQNLHELFNDFCEQRLSALERKEGE